MDLPQLTDQIEGKLRTALKLSPEQAIPTEVLEIFDDVTRTARMLGFQFGDRELLLVAMLAKMPTPADPLSFLDTAKTCEVGTRVLARFRNQWRWGRFIRVNGFDKKIEISLDDDEGTDKRSFQPTSVRLPTREELKLIGEA